MVKVSPSRVYVTPSPQVPVVASASSEEKTMNSEAMTTTAKAPRINGVYLTEMVAPEDAIPSENKKTVGISFANAE